MKNIRKTTLAFILILLFSQYTTPSFAQNTTRFKVNRDYGGIHAIAVPQEFEIFVPAKNLLTHTTSKLKSKTTYVKFDFLTSDGKVKKNLKLSYLKIPLGKADERLKTTKDLLLKRLTTIANAPPEKISTIKISQYDAVIVMTQYDIFSIALVGIINPKSHHSIMAIIYSDLPSDSQSLENILLKSQSMKALNSFKFGRELM